MITSNNMKAIFTFIGKVAGLIVMGLVAYEEFQASLA
jgi:hypothetical protein